MMFPHIYPLSENAATVAFGDQMDDALHQQVLQLDQAIRQEPFAGWVENVPAYASLTVFYQREKIAVSESISAFEQVRQWLHSKLANENPNLTLPTQVLRIPVCYEAPFAPDLDFMADFHGVSREALIALHQQDTYKVYMMGFLPGFAYMGAVDEKLSTPRKSTPRARVPAGSVGIAGRQTGIYPFDTPGGWQIIGKTPLKMLDWGKSDPFLLKTGDLVQFYAISKETFEQWEQTEHGAATFLPDLAAADALVLKPGPYSTIQDLGRTGFRAYGVPVGGAMDTFSHQKANALLGNAAQAATIECTMGGLVLQWQKTTKIALAGAGTTFINGQNISLEQVYEVTAKDVLEIRFHQSGLRCYLAVEGGFDSPSILNSKSMNPLIGIGAPLKKGDALYVDRNSARATPEKTDWPGTAYTARIRVYRGPEFEWLSPESQARFFTQNYTMSHRFDRMGCHVQSDPLTFSATRELLSTAVAPGTIQCTPAGQLILLLQDCQTVGGYPRVGQIAAVDLPKVAQWVPGEKRIFTMGRLEG
ncbi:MAG: 5-oxoprolinase subunit PxpB [Chitinophagales bacterium]|nr:5-oxoprolinase subunit PxpB [Chitinophagales bacterium]